MIQSLLVDIGNSNTAFARWDNGCLQRLGQCETSELATYLEGALFTCHRVIVSSVVPECHAVMTSFFTTVFFVTADTLPLLSVEVSCPDQVGVDRLVTALAASKEYKKECVIIDAGTAITCDRVSADSRYLGGLIVPGMGLASHALHEYTAQIPLIWVEHQTSLLGQSTQESVASGLYFGYREMINGLITQFKTQTPDLVVIGTGNGLSVFGDELVIDYYHDDLQFKGLSIIAETLNAPG